MSKSFQERITEKTVKLTTTEQKIVSELLEKTQETVFLSGPQLANRLNVHEAAATRLAQKLGYKGYPDLRKSLQKEELDRHSAASRMRRSVCKVKQGDYFADLINMEISALEGLSKFINQKEIDKAADTLVKANKVYIFGQGHAQSIAHFLHRRLERFGMTTISLTGRGKDIAERLVSLGSSDVILCLAFRKQPRSYAALINNAHKKGAHTILISDLAGPTMDPPTAQLLAAPRGRSGSEFQTPTIPFAIANGILLTIAGRHRGEVIGKLEDLSEIMNMFDDD